MVHSYLPIVFFIWTTVPYPTCDSTVTSSINASINEKPIPERSPVVSVVYIGSIAFSMVMVRVAPGEDIKSVAEAMKSGINPRKWVCVEADDMLVTGYRDVVMLIMLDTSCDLTAQSFVDAFGKVVGEPEFVI